MTQYPARKNSHVVIRWPCASGRTQVTKWWFTICIWRNWYLCRYVCKSWISRWTNNKRLAFVEIYVCTYVKTNAIKYWRNAQYDYSQKNICMYVRKRRVPQFICKQKQMKCKWPNTLYCYIQSVGSEVFYSFRINKITSV